MKKEIKQGALVALLGLLGYALFSFPGRFLQQYEAARSHGDTWGYLFLAATALGLLLLSAAMAWTVWVVVRNTRRGTKRRKSASVPASSIPEDEKLKEIERNIQEATSAAEKSSKGEDFARAIQEGASRIQRKLENTVLEIAAAGTVSSGKSSLLNVLAGRHVFDTHVSGGTTRAVQEIDLPGGDRVKLVDMPGLAEAGGQEAEEIARQAASSADLILFVLDGPLKDFEYQAISRLRRMEKRVIVCLNKQDWFSDEDLEILVRKLRSQLRGLVEPEDLVTVQAAEVERSIIRVSPDGTETRETEIVPPDISALVERMTQLIDGERRQIVLCSLLLQSRMLKKDTEERIRKLLVSRARAIVDSYTWKAALAAAASPTPILDVASGLGFSLKMILDIAAVFERKIEISDARELLNQLMKNLYASLGASALAPAVAQVVASGLKGVPAAGTLSGGALQGLVQAVVTRWIGLVMVDYFRARKEDEEEMDIGTKAMEEWKKLTSPSRLAALAAEGLRRFKTEADKAKQRS